MNTDPTLARGSGGALLLTLLLSACSSDSTEGGSGGDAGPSRDVGTSRDAAGGDDATVSIDLGLGDDGSIPGDANDADALEDAAPSDATGGDLAPDETPPDAGGADAAPDAAPDPNDRDGDGFIDADLGGDDCDDTNPRVRPDANEVCDFVDNDCSGVVNDGITCEVYAHTSSELFLVDPFAGTSRRVTSVPGLLDFDTAPDGTLYGITSSALYRFDAARSRWDVVSNSGISSVGVNGFAIDSTSKGYATGRGTVYRVDLVTGAMNEIGDFGGGYVSSGDCVIDKDDNLYMTASGVGSNDVLVRVDTSSGVATPIGANLGFSSVFGLTVAWGYMFGFTSSGELIQIDTRSGRGSLVSRVSGVWYGAASSPQR